MEMVVVCIIIVVLASMSLPYLGSNVGRRFDHAAEQVADLLTMFAHRDHLGRTPIGIFYDERYGALMLVRLDTEDDEFDARAEWIPDPFVTPVKFPDEVDTRSLWVMADGEPVRINDRPLAHTPGEERPSIEISFVSTDGTRFASLVLAPHAITPRRVDDRRSVVPRAVDLDAEGRTRDEW